MYGLKRNYLDFIVWGINTALVLILVHFINRRHYLWILLYKDLMII